MNIERRIYDYDEVKENLRLKLINRELNSKLLEKVPHQDFLDLAVIVTLEYDLEEGISSSTYINYDFLKIWKKSFEEVYKEAYHQFISDDPVIKSICEVLSGFIRTEMSYLDDLSLYVLTNKKGVNGAVQMLKEHVLQDFANKHNSDVFVIPSSIHEVLLYPVKDNVTKEEVTYIVQCVNTTEVKPKDVLSDHVYVYKNKKGLSL